MAVLNIAILATLLPAILAYPQNGGHMGHGPVRGSKLPSGFPTGFPHPSGIPGGPHHIPRPWGAPFPSSAPFPAPGNGTTGGATGSGTGSPISTGISPPESNPPETGAPGPVTIQSTLFIIPQPVSTGAGAESPASTGAPGGGESPASGLGGSSPSGAPGSGSSPSEVAGSGPSPSEAAGSGSSPSGAPGSGSGNGGENGGTCGPATVTVTQANTVTVTVPAVPASAAPESGAPGGGSPESQAPIPAQSASASVASAPFPFSNSSIAAGPTGTGTGASVPPIFSTPIVLPISPIAPVVTISAAPVGAPVVSSVAAPVPVNTVQEASDGQAYVPSSTSAPAVAEATSQAAPVKNVPVQALYSVHSHADVHTTAAPSPSVTPVPDTNSAPQVVSSAAPSVSSTPKSSGGVKARGLIYGSLPAAQAFDMSNIGWCADWDSSVTPGVGKTQGSISCEFVPQLLSNADVHTSIWAANSAGASYAAGPNEPDNCGGGGACMSVGDTVSAWGTYMNGMSANLVSPATTNDLVTPGKGLDFMTQFLKDCAGCKFQALAFHFYGNAWDINDTPGGLEPTIQAYQKLQQQYHIPELWISEMAPNQAPTEDQMSAMLSYLDSSPVTRYAWNGLDTGTGQQLSGMMASTYAS